LGLGWQGQRSVSAKYLYSEPSHDAEDEDCPKDNPDWFARLRQRRHLPDEILNEVKPDQSEHAPVRIVVYPRVDDGDKQEIDCKKDRAGVEVPWLVCDSDDRRRIVAEKPEGEQTESIEEVESLLRDLGYQYYFTLL
jgi:hypothetical protein